MKKLRARIILFALINEDALGIKINSNLIAKFKWDFQRYGQILTR